MANDAIYRALESVSLPVNPLPFGNKLMEHVRLRGTDSIKSDEAKRLLWILMGQAYGTTATINMLDEWDRLANKDLDPAKIVGGV